MSNPIALPATDEKSAVPLQQEMPFAIIQGTPLTELPKDLYIPPTALEVILEAFEGPLDLLLYLIKKQNLDILDICVTDITKQYMHYIELMNELDIELAAEYLVMASMLAEIKSRMLLPRPKEAEEEDETDPRMELIRRLQEYERFKAAAEDLDALPRKERDIHLVKLEAKPQERIIQHPDLDLRELLLALNEVMRREDWLESHQIKRELLSTRERMTNILHQLRSSPDTNFLLFTAFFQPQEGRMGVVVTFLAIMELVKESLIELVQNEPLGAIHVRTKTHE